MIRADIHVNFPQYALNASLEIPSEGITAFFGPSGAGKTTLLRAIAGLERAHNSFVQVGDAVWQDDANGVFVPPHQRTLGFVFQGAHLFEHLNVRRNLEFGMKRVPDGARFIEIEKIIDLLGIGHLLERQPGTLSGGERQRVGIARALATSPSVLLLDEPLSALDVQRKQEIIPYLERLNHQLKIPMLYVTHAIDEVVRLADHMVLLDGGNVTAAGATQNLLTRLDLPLAFGEGAAAIIDGRVASFDEAYQICRVAFDGGHFDLPSHPVAIGQPVRVRVQARDVSLMLVPQVRTSILNTLPVTVTDLSEDAVGQVIIGLDTHGTRLLCRVTKRSAALLEVSPGKPMFAQVKGVAII